MKDEEFYDVEIAPALAELAKKCASRDMAFFAAVEFDAGGEGEGVGKTFMASDRASGADMTLIQNAAMSCGNFDILAFATAKLEHDSVVLDLVNKIQKP